MTVKKCNRNIYESVEVCGGVCECAGETACSGCNYNKRGDEAVTSFISAFNKEYGE